jgi:hypothetical protein
MVKADGLRRCGGGGGEEEEKVVVNGYLNCTIFTNLSHMG